MESQEPAAREESPEAESSEASGVGASQPELELPPQSPLFHAEQSDRYERQSLFAAYQEHFDCRLIAVVDQLLPYSITLFEELIYDANPAQDLHLLLVTPGGDGETAVRLARSAQARCREFTVIVPDQAKSAGTILALGAHHILMGPVSDLGPIDPQIALADGTTLVSAKDIIAAVDEATSRVQAAPETYALHAALLADVTALMVQQARAALARTDDLLEEALRANKDRSNEEVNALRASLADPLITSAKSHGAIFGLDEALAAGLPVTPADPASAQWQVIWRLWAKYFAMSQRFYEGERASKMFPWPQPEQA